MIRTVHVLIVLFFMLTGYCSAQNITETKIQSEKILYRGYSNPILLDDLPFKQKGIKWVTFFFWGVD